MSDGTRRWMTIKEAADYTRTDVDWVLGHVRDGSLPYVPTARRTVDNAKGPRRRVVDRVKLDALMERLEVIMDAPATRRDEAGPGPDPGTLAAMSVRERILRGLEAARRP